MSNQSKNTKRSMHGIAAVSLAAALAAFGCSSDQDRTMRTAPATGPTIPSSNTSSSYAPMTSSSSSNQVISPSMSRADRAAAVVAGLTPLGSNVRVLGPASPQSGGQVVYGTSGAYQDAAAAQGRVTVNSTIFSPPTPVYGGDNVGGTVIGAVTSDGSIISNNAIVGGMTSNSTITNGTTAGITAPSTVTGSTVTGTNAPTVTAANAANATTASTATTAGVPTPTAASLPFTAGVFATGTGTLTPTLSSSLVPNVTLATSAIAPVFVGTGTTTTGLTTAGTTNTTTGTTTGTTAKSTVTGRGVTAGVRSLTLAPNSGTTAGTSSSVVSRPSRRRAVSITNVNGRVTMTNVNQ